MFKICKEYDKIESKGQLNGVGKDDDMEQNELVKKMKKKRVRKYALIALVCVIAVSTIVGLSIENKDAKLTDGQGNTVIGTGEDVYENDGKDDAEEEKPDDKAQTEKDKDSNKGKKASDLKFTEEEKKDLDAKDIKVDNSDDPTASNGGNAALRPEKEEPVTVTLEIRCDTLSNDMDRLENPAIKDYIPKDGVILERTTYKGTTNNTVFDALNTLCRNNDIQLEFSYTPLYASYYIEGINYLYEFDGGPQSGWMYKVNEWFPNYGCSSYYLKDGDTIVWCYTCEGLGTDVGADEWMG